jgi:hypothetical protein
LIVFSLDFSNTQGGHEIMNISTGHIVRRRQVKQVPMTTHDIICIQRMADDKKIPDGLKIL